MLRKFESKFFEDSLHVFVSYSHIPFYTFFNFICLFFKIFMIYSNMNFPQYRKMTLFFQEFKSKQSLSRTYLYHKSYIAFYNKNSLIQIVITSQSPNSFKIRVLQDPFSPYPSKPDFFIITNSIQSAYTLLKKKFPNSKFYNLTSNQYNQLILDYASNNTINNKITHRLYKKAFYRFMVHYYPSLEAREFLRDQFLDSITKLEIELMTQS